MISRRSVLKATGALVVSFSLPASLRVAGFAQEAPAEPNGLEIPPAPTFSGDGQLELTPNVAGWVRVSESGEVTLYTGKVELGHGILTALGQIVVEELDVPFENLTVVSADTDLVPNQGITSATTTIGIAGPIMRKVAATARQELLDLASDELAAEVDHLEVQDGMVRVVGEPDRHVSYGALIGGKQFERSVDHDAPVKNPMDYRVVGQSVARIDLPGKLTASADDYRENDRVPGMKFARTLRAPAFGAKLVSYDESVEEMPGVVAVLPFRFPGDERLDRVERLGTMPGDFISVVANREDQAQRAVERLREGVEWEVVDTLPTTHEKLYDWLVDTGEKIGIQEDYTDQESRYNAALDISSETVTASYKGPFLAHGALSPAWALADVRDDAATVWTASQWPFGTRWMVAQALGFEREDQVHVIGGASSGLYGRRDDYDQEVDVEAALISQEIGAPVRLQWSREDDFVWAPYRPPHVVSLEAGLDDAGQIKGLQAHIYTALRGTHPGADSVGDPFPAAPYELGPRPMEGYNAGPLLRTGYMRNVYRGYNLFALESFMDEVAAQADIDPVEFRLQHLEDERAIAVIEAATERAGWQQFSGSSGRGMGMSFALYTGHDDPSAIYMAYVAEVEVDEGTGEIQVRKVTCAIDPGLIVNPDGVRNQVEGGVIQATSWALKEEVTFDNQRVTNVDWVTYPILTFPEVPEIDVVLVDRTDQPSKGVGEPVTVLVAPAIANAVYDAVGARVRQLPMTPDRVMMTLADS